MLRTFSLLDIFFIYISNVIPFPYLPSKKPLCHIPSSCSPTHPLLLPCPGSPLQWGIWTSQEQGPLLPLMSNKVILCYICSWSYRSLHVYSLVGGLFSPWELWGYWLVHIVVSPMGLQTPSVPRVLSLASSMGTLCSVQWMAVSIHVCICQCIVSSI